MRPLSSQEPRPGRHKAADLIEQTPALEKPFDPERDITPEDWAGMRGRLEINHRNRYWPDFTEQAANMAIIAPERKAELGIDAAWQRMLDELEGYRHRSDRLRFINQATGMAILAADEIRITEKGGLELTSHVTESQTPLPQRRTI